MTAVTRPAPAKLNLTLQIVGRREDGYHLLDSLVAFTEYGDVVEAEPADELSLTMDGPFGGALTGDSAENLVLRAARERPRLGSLLLRAPRSCWSISIRRRCKRPQRLIVRLVQDRRQHVQAVRSFARL